MKLTIIYTYYGQKERIPGIVAEKHPEARVVVVDDCYPEPLEKLDSVEVYRVTDDIPWNQPGAKNLAFHLSEGWIVCADIDHLVTKEMAQKLIDLDKKRGTIYFLGREDTPSWNIFLIHKDDFEKVGGYDEDFSGHYGHDDTLFLWMCEKSLNVVEQRDIKAKVFAEESSTQMERNTRTNQELLEKKKHLKHNVTPRLRFNWKKVYG